MNLQDFTKKITLAALFGVSILGSGLVNGQATITVSANPTNLPCSGGSVNLSAVGNSSITVLGSNFDNNSAGPGWVVSPAGVFTNPCGPSPSGTPHMWMGNTTAAPRTLQTANLDVSCGGQVCFDFRMAIQGQNSPCEGPDLYNEGVNLQYSINGGTTWVNIAYFAPNGDLLVTNPGTNNPTANGNTPFTTWQNYCFNIPAAAQTATTMFRWFQSGSSGTVYDHWGIDEVTITAQTCFPYYYDWQHIPGSPDAANVTANITTTTTFECCYTNGINDTVCDQVTVNVASLPAPTITLTDETCFGDADGTVIIDNPGGNGPYQVTVSGPVTQTYTEGNGAPDAAGPYTNLPAGVYTVNVVGSGSCTWTGTFTIAAGPPCCTVTATGSNPLCNGACNGSVTATPTGTAPFSYSWSNSGGQTTQTASNLCSGTYTVTMTDNQGCVQTASVTLTNPPALTGSATPTAATCNGNCNGSISFTANGGTPGYQYSTNNGSSFSGTSNVTGLCANSYNLVIRDANGCLLPLTTTITQPTALTLAQTATTQATCGASNGTLTVQASGGTPGPGYTYTLGATSNGSGNFTGLAAGTHTVTVTDNNGCTATVNVTITSSAGPSPFVDVQSDVLCAGGFNGSVTIGVSGGTGPFTYTLDVGTPQASNTFTVTAGPHTVTVTDANGCTGSVNFTINQPSPLTISNSVVNASCAGVCDGQITVTASGSTAPYMYSSNGGLTFQASNVLTGICAGTAQVVVQDVNGCLANSNVPVTQPSTVSATFTMTEPLCNDGCDGSLVINASGGTPAYTYSIDNGTTFQASSTFNNLCAGNYDVVVEDANGCQFTTTEPVTEPVAIQLTMAGSNPSNCGFNDGDFTIVASNGTPSYQYSLNGGPLQSSGFFPFLSAGLYTVIAVDANGCSDSSLFPINDQQLVSSLDAFQDPSCFNSCDGAVIVSSVNGAPPITYSYNNGIPQSTGVFIGLCAEVGYVTIQDNGFCIDNIPINLTEPDSVTYTVSKTDIVCNGDSTGSITFSNPQGGDGGPYEYSIDNGVTFQSATTFNNLPAGTYNVVTRDGNGCIGSDQITLTQPNPFTAIINVTNVFCNGASTGLIQIVAGGNTSPYEYSVDNGATFQSATAFALLPANTYNIVIRDDNLCTFDTFATVTQPTSITATYVVADAQCNGACDGTVTVTASGGTPPYLYSPDGGTTFQSSNVVGGLCAGSHTIQVRDDNDCILNAAQVIAEPTLLSFTFDTTSTTCGQPNGDVTFTPSGGTPPYQFSADGGTTFSGSNVITGLTAGTIDLVVQDANGCQSTQSITLLNENEPVINNVSTTNPLCFNAADGSITVTASSGSAPLLYSIDGVNFVSTNVFTGLAAGPYTVTVQDGNGCSVIDNTVTLTNPPQLSFTSTATNVLCNGQPTGGITITASGGTTPYQYSFDNGATFQGAPSLTFIPAGTYNLNVQDANGCLATGQQVITQPTPLQFTNFIIDHPSCNGVCDGSVSAIVSGGTVSGVYTFNWSNNIAPTSSSQAVNVCAGTYTVIVTDDNNCSVDSTNFVLIDPPIVTINNVVASDVLCNGDCNGTITINSPGAVQYSVDGGNTFGASNVISNLCPGNYDVVVVDNIGCEGISNTTVGEPNALAVNVPTFSETCFEDTISLSAFTTGGVQPYSFVWSTGQTTQSFDTTLTSSQNFQVTVTDANGCTINSTTTTVGISSAVTMNITVSADTICLGDSSQIIAHVTGGQLGGNPAAYNYLWSTNAIDSSITVSPTTATNYSVRVIDGCNDTIYDSVTVYLYQQPIVSFVGGTNGCEDHTVNLINTTPPFMVGGNCVWTMGDGTTLNSCNTINHTYTTPGCYDVTLSVTSPDGCAAQTTVVDYICVYELPVADFAAKPSSPTIIDPVVKFTDESYLANQYFWDFGDGSNETVSDPTHKFPTTLAQNYEVCLTVTSIEGCVDSYCDTIKVRDEFVVFVPNAFSPDGDGNNEVFLPVLQGYSPESYQFQVFDRWGELIFESHHENLGWDGTVSGFDSKPDVYVWKLVVKSDYDAEAKEFQGHVTLVR